MKQLIINADSREKRFALIKDGQLEKLYIEQPGQESKVGNIYLGVVEKVIPGMNAAFVNYGEEMSGFLIMEKLPRYVLSDDENKSNRPISSYLHQGERLLVQIEKDAAGTKGARLTAIIEIQGANLVFMPNGKYIAVSKKAETHELREKWRNFAKEHITQEEGLIFRTESLKRREEEIIRELEQQRTNYLEMLQKASDMKKPSIVYERDSFFEQASGLLSESSVVVDSLVLKKKFEMVPDCKVSLYTGNENIFSFYKIEQEIDRLMKRIVWLEKGAYLVIDQAEAMTVIDVNTGKFSGKNNLSDTVIKTNLQAAAEAARQIRLRDLAGIILIDFIDMKDIKEQELVLSSFKKELQKDDRRTRIVGFTELGVLQLTRKKTKQSITEILSTRCETCGGTGLVLSAETMAFRLERELWEYRRSDHEAVLVSATEDVISCFSGVSDVHKSRLEEATGLKIVFTEIQSERPVYEIRKFGVAAELTQM